MAAIVWMMLAALLHCAAVTFSVFTSFPLFFASSVASCIQKSTASFTLWTAVKHTRPVLYCSIHLSDCNTDWRISLPGMEQFILMFHVYRNTIHQCVIQLLQATFININTCLQLHTYPFTIFNTSIAGMFASELSLNFVFKNYSYLL